MSNILKFPDRNSPASKKEFDKLFKYKKLMEFKDEQALKYAKQFIKKLISISNHVGPLTKKEKFELLKEFKENYKNKFIILKQLLQL